MSLTRYKQKRNFTITPEPEGTPGTAREGGLAFVIQKHAATRLHYDFRLELDGVLLSWAVPKGPSLDPNDKRMAVHVEDHPLEYGDFEGVIPAKQYGAGTVMLWDRGIWIPREDPRAGYAKGKLKFELQGEKLRGVWNLVKSRSAKYQGDTWLLFKEADAFARLHAEAAVVDLLPNSVASGRTLDEIKAHGDRVWHSNRSASANVAGEAVRTRKRVARLEDVAGARKAPLPDVIDPQLATLVKVPVAGEQWVHEIKYDGYRMLCRIAGNDARMMSRNRKDWTEEFATIARAAARLPVDDAWLDGEVVVVDEQGRTSFQALQNVLSMQDASTLLYYVFDLPYLDGHDLRYVPLLERKRILRDLLAGAPTDHLRYSEHFAVPGADFFRSVTELGLEGMVSKRADCPYRAHRSSAWLKLKCARRQPMVIGGWSDPGGSRPGFGALLIGYYDEAGRLTYAGKVGTGFDDATLQSLRLRLDGIARKESPFHNPPIGAEARKAHWVEPVLVANVSFTEWTDDGTLRHPGFHGLREDTNPKQVVRETDDPARREPRGVDPGAASADAAQVASDTTTAAAKRASRTRTAARKSGSGDANMIAGVALTNPDKVLYPEAKITKRELAQYYERIAPWMLPHIVQRPITLVRCPNGWQQECFYQKNIEASANAAITRVRITGSDGSTSWYMGADDATALVAMLQLGALELHPWGSQVPKRGFPDRLIFDLDPADDVDWEHLVQAAHLVKTLLENIGLCAFLKTTGGKGLHVVLPIEPTVPWEHAKGFTKAVAELLERTFPDRFTSKLLKVSRHGRIFIDYLRNAEGATAVAAYSFRAKAHASVATPIAWEELEHDVRYAHFTVRNVPQRVAKMKRDPWHDIRDRTHILTRAAMLKVGYKP